MRGRILFVAGLAVGYVLGTKAGRERYEQIAAVADRVWNSAGVQRGVGQVEDFVKEHAPDVVSLAADGVKKVAGRTTTSGKRTTRSSGTARSTATARKAPSTRSSTTRSTSSDDA